MYDLASGFNIGTNYSLTPDFNQMMGFTEEEVREMLTYYSTTSLFIYPVIRVDRNDETMVRQLLFCTGLLR